MMFIQVNVCGFSTYLIGEVTVTALKVGRTPAADWLIDVVLGCNHDDEHGEDHHSVCGIELVGEGVPSSQSGVSVVSHVTQQAIHGSLPSLLLLMLLSMKNCAFAKGCTWQKKRHNVQPIHLWLPFVFKDGL